MCPILLMYSVDYNTGVRKKIDIDKRADLVCLCRLRKMLQESYTYAIPNPYVPPSASPQFVRPYTNSTASALGN